MLHCTLWPVGNQCHACQYRFIGMAHVPQYVDITICKHTYTTPTVYLFACLSAFCALFQHAGIADLIHVPHRGRPRFFPQGRAHDAGDHGHVHSEVLVQGIGAARSHSDLTKPRRR